MRRDGACYGDCKLAWSACEGARHAGRLVGRGDRARTGASNAIWRAFGGRRGYAVRHDITIQAYLARYVYKVAIGEQRIVSIDDQAVTFRYRKVHSKRVRTMRLPIAEFMRRFLQHVLPTGFVKVRYFGFLSPNCDLVPQKWTPRGRLN